MNRRQFLTATALACATPLAFAQSSAPYKIIGFTKPFQELDHEQGADTVEQIGWDGIECPVRPRGQIEPDGAADELPKLMEALKKRGKEISIVTTAITSVSDKQTEPLLRTISKLGLKRYRLGSFKYTDKKSIPDQLADFTAALRDLAALNKELGLTGAVQNHSGRDYFGAPIWDIWTAIKDLDPQHIGTMFDIGHATIEGGLSWPIESRLMEPHLTAVFVKDFKWEKSERGARMQWVPLGEGQLTKSYFDWLKKTRFSGPICQHVEYNHGKGQQLVANLKKDLKVLLDWLA